MVDRVFLIASAFDPVCGMCAISGVPVCWKLLSFSRLPAEGACARPGEANAIASAETAPKPITLMVSSLRPSLTPDAGRIIAQASGCVRQQLREIVSGQAREVMGEVHDVRVGQ